MESQKISRHHTSHKPSTSFHSYHDENSKKLTRSFNQGRDVKSHKGDNRKFKTITQKEIAASESFENDCEFDRNKRGNINKYRLEDQRFNGYRNKGLFGDTTNMDIITIKGPNITIRPCTSVETIKSFDSTVGCAVGRLFPIRLSNSMKPTGREKKNKHGEIENFIKENFSVLKVDKGAKQECLLVKSNKIEKKNSVAKSTSPSAKDLKDILPPRRDGSQVSFNNDRIDMGKLDTAKDGHTSKRKKVEAKEKRNKEKVSDEKIKSKSGRSRKVEELNYYHKRKDREESPVREKRSTSLIMTEKKSRKNSDYKDRRNHSSRKMSDTGNILGEISGKDFKKSKNYNQSENFICRRNRLRGARSSKDRRSMRNRSLEANVSERRSSVKGIRNQESPTGMKDGCKLEEAEKNQNKRAKSEKELNQEKLKNNLYSYLTLGLFRGRRGKKDLEKKISDNRGKNKSKSRVSMTRKSRILNQDEHSLKNYDENKIRIEIDVISSNNSRKSMNDEINGKRGMNQKEKRMNESGLESSRRKSESELGEKFKKSNQQTTNKPKESWKPLKFFKTILERNERQQKSKMNVDKTKQKRLEKKSSIGGKRSKQRVTKNGKAGVNKTEESRMINIIRRPSAVTTKSEESQNNMRKVSFFIANSLFKNVVSSKNWYMGGPHL